MDTGRRRRARHRAGDPADGGARPPRYRGALAGSALVVALVLAGAGAVLALERPGGTPSTTPSSTAPRPVAPGTAAPSGAGTPGTGASAAGAELARWAGTELPPGDRLVAAPGEADALRRAGVPAGVVAAGSGGAGDELAVTDGTVPAGSRLVARFGAPTAFAVVDPAPVAPTAAELQRRRDLAVALLANPTSRVAAPAAAVLRAAAVDPRLLAVLAALTARSGIGITALPAAADEPSDVPLARSALIGEVGGRPVTTGSPDVPALVAFLRAQLPPYRPAEVTVTSAGVLVGYRYLGAPDAAVTAASY